MHRIGLIGDNSLEYVKKLLEIWEAGNCAVLIDWRIPKNSAEEMLKEADVKYCYIERKLYDKWNDDNQSKVELIPYDTKHGTAEILPADFYDRYKDDYSANEAVILFSSGTTGKAKGVILSHYAISTNADSILDYMNLTDKDCFYIAKTLAHSSTLVGELLVCLKSHTKVVIANTVMIPRFIIRNIVKYKATRMAVNPTVLSLLLNDKALSELTNSSLKVLYVSGAVLRKNLWEKAKSYLHNVELYNVYGLSEAGPRVTAQNQDYCTENSVGRPILNVEVEIRNDSNETLEKNNIGVIYVKTQSCFSGYLNSPDSELVDGYFNTKDLGYLNDQGELVIVGRADDVIISSSHNVLPYGIESVILASGEVTECAVVGIPDELHGEKIVCVYIAQNEISTLKMTHYCEQYLPPYEVPQKWIKVDEISANNNGKVNRKYLKKYVMEREENETGNN